MEIRDQEERSYTNGEITVYWKPELCIHATVCFTDLPKVFQPEKKPWINIQGATTAEIIKTVNDCPTDALSFRYNTEEENSMKEKKDRTQIRQMLNGPNLIQGNFEIIDHNGETIKTGKNTALCACGKSKNKPFCDGSHLK